MDNEDLHEQTSQAVAETLQIIRLLHQGPDLASVPVVYYGEWQPFGRYVPADGMAGHIEISLYGPHPHLTFAHEVGHLLDQAIVGYTGYASATEFSALSGVMNAIRQSNACRSLQALAASNSQTLPERLAKRRAAYWSSAEELWARAYAQYAATRSDNPQMQAEVRHAQILETHAAGTYVQWENNDFIAIAEAIDAALQKLRWMP